MPESPGAEKQDKEKELRDSKKNRGETNHSAFGSRLATSRRNPLSILARLPQR